MKKNDCCLSAKDLAIHVKQAQADVEFLKQANQKLESICRNASELAAYNHAENVDEVIDSSQADHEEINNLLNDLYTQKISLFKKITKSL